MVESYKLTAKQILLLLSNQLVQMFEDLADKRVPAVTRRLVIVRRLLCATLGPPYRLTR